MRIKTAQAQLGHAGLRTTAEMCTHQVPASQPAAIEKLERPFVGNWAQMDPT
jgi:hypothetical protein